MGIAYPAPTVLDSMETQKMIDTTYESKAMRARGPAQTDRDVLTRIRAEYREMPGMRLTLAVRGPRWPARRGPLTCSMPGPRSRESGVETL